MVILDTSVIIDHLRQPPAKSALIKMFKARPEEVLAISVMSIQELYEGKSTKNEEKEEHLLSTLAVLEVMPYTVEVARLAGTMARDLKRSIELADAAIAATTILNQAQLFTLNKRDFRGIKNLDLWEEAV